MEKKSFTLAILIATGLVLLLIIGFASYASDVTGARYSGTVRITSNSTSSTENVCTVFTLNMPNLLSLGYADNSDDFVILTNAGAEAIFMPSNNSTNPWCVYVPLIGTMYNLDYRLYSGNTSGGKIRYFPGPAGMSITDNETIELGDNFTIGYYGYVDNTKAGEIIFRKDGSIIAAIDASGNLTVSNDSMFSRNGEWNLDFVRTNSDWVEVADQDDFSFTDGAGNDKPFTITAWVNLDDATSGDIITKFDTGGLYEWGFNFDATDSLRTSLLKSDATAYIGRKTAAMTGNQGAWHHYALTYDGSETNDGIDIYVDAVVSDTANNSMGVYAGMSNTATKVNIGSANNGGINLMDGHIAEVRVYSSELSQSEITNDMAGTVQSNLIAHWKIDEGVGNPQDDSGNGYHGINNGADWVEQFTIGGVLPTLTSSISSGERYITVSGNTTHITMEIDSLVVDEEIFAGSITDLSSSLTVCSEATLYMERFFIQVDGATTCNISWQYTTGNFTDASGYGNDAVPSYRTTTSDSDITASLLNFAPVTQSRADPDDVSYEGEIVDEIPEEPTTMYTETTSPGIFFAPLVNPLLDAGNVDRTLFWYPFAYVIAILFGILTFRFTQSLLLQAIVEGAFILLFALPGINVYGAWTVIYFGLEAFGVIIMSKHFTW